MNPYQPPKSEEPAGEVAEHAVMEVRYGLGYSLSVICTALVILRNTIADQTFLPWWLYLIVGATHLVMGVATLRTEFFVVYEDRIGFVSPFFPRRVRRQFKPLESIDAKSLFYRWLSNRSDFKRFIDWRESRRG